MPGPCRPRPQATTTRRGDSRGELREWAELVARRARVLDDAARQGGMAAHVLAHEEERRGHVVRGQYVENRLRSARVGPVVEREVAATAVAGSAPDHPAEQSGVRLEHAVSERAGHGGAGREREPDHRASTRLYTPRMRAATRGHANSAALASPAAPIASRRAGSSINRIAVSAQAAGSSLEMSTASPPPRTSSRNPVMSDTTIGVPHAIASMSVTPNEERVVGQRYRSAPP